MCKGNVSKKWQFSWKSDNFREKVTIFREFHDFQRISWFSKSPRENLTISEQWKTMKIIEKPWNTGPEILAWRYWPGDTGPEMLAWRYWPWDVGLETWALRYWPWDMGLDILALRYWPWDIGPDTLALRYWPWYIGLEILALRHGPVDRTRSWPVDRTRSWPVDRTRFWPVYGQVPVVRVRVLVSPRFYRVSAPRKHPRFWPLLEKHLFSENHEISHFWISETTTVTPPVTPLVTRRSESARLPEAER